MMERVRLGHVSPSEALRIAFVWITEGAESASLAVMKLEYLLRELALPLLEREAGS